MDSLYDIDDLEFIKHGDVIVPTPKEIFAPQKRRGSSVKEDLYRHLYAFFLLHPEQREDEFGDVLYFFVMEHETRKSMAKKHVTWEKYGEATSEKEAKLLQWAELHRNEVDAWGACLFWLKDLLRTHKSYMELD